MDMYKVIHYDQFACKYGDASTCEVLGHLYLKESINFYRQACVGGLKSSCKIYKDFLEKIVTKDLQ